MNKHEDLENQWVRLNDAMKQLQIALAKCEFIACNYYSLPPMLTSFENHTIEKIPCIPFQDRKALFSCGAAFSKFYIMPDWSSKMSQRYPGVIQIRKDKQTQLGEIFKQINEAKIKLSSILNSIPNQRSKRTAMDKLMNNSSTKAILRLIYTINDTENDISKITFHWNHRPNVRKITKQATIAQLNQLKAKPQDGMAKVIWERRIDISINKINSLSDSCSLRIKRPTKAQPMVNVRSKTKGWMQHTAALPIVVFSDEQITYEHLQSYDSLHRRTTRADSILGDTQVIEQIPIYVVDEKQKI